MRDSLALSQTSHHRRGMTHVYVRQDLHPDEVLEVMAAAGEIIKNSRKASVRRVRDCIIKESRSGWGLGLLKHTLQRERYRAGWRAAHFLREQGVGVPEPLAFVEWRFAGLILGNAMISEYLEGHRNVEDFLRALIQRGAGEDTIVQFLAALADAVNALEAARAYHTDLSGKNIFTRDGTGYYFIDLDAVLIDCAPDEQMRLKNHVQLYDSFCDTLSDKLLVPFILKMLPEELDPRVWMPQVRKLQRERRQRHQDRE